MPSKATVTSGPMLPPLKAMSGSVFLLWLESVLVTMAPVATEGYSDARVHGLSCHPRPWGMSKSGLLLRAMPEFIVLLQLGSVLMSTDHIPAKGQVDVCGLGCLLKPR